MRARGALASGANRPQREADHSPPSSYEVKNGGSIPPPHTSSSCRAAVAPGKLSEPYPYRVPLNFKRFQQQNNSDPTGK
jgi:hypothetical protein